METALTDLWYGFTVAIEPHNLMYCFLGVLIGNMVGVLPGQVGIGTFSPRLDEHGNSVRGVEAFERLTGERWS